MIVSINKTEYVFFGRELLSIVAYFLVIAANAFRVEKVDKNNDAVITARTVDTENALAGDHPVIKRGEKGTKSQPAFTNRRGKIAINLSVHTVIQSRGPYRQVL